MAKNNLPKQTYKTRIPETSFVINITMLIFHLATAGHYGVCRKRIFRSK